MLSAVKSISPSLLSTRAVFFPRVVQHAFMTTRSFPTTVDLNLIGRCNLNCTWCWGPEHHAPEPIQLNQWKELAVKLQSLGTKNVVITGGEPLLKRWLPDLIQFIKLELNMRITLSTNGILLRRKANEILPYVDDLGLPLDGPSDHVNKQMRIGKFNHFEIAVDVFKYVQCNFPHIDLTLRTVVAKPNLNDVPQIGQVLIQAGVNPEKLRWKLYQVNPIGPRKKEILEGDWLITLSEFEQAIVQCKTLNPQIKICSQPFDKHVGRYFMVFPDGESHAVEMGPDGFPCEKPLGNVFKNLDTILNHLSQNTCLENNGGHGCVSRSP